MAFDVLANLKKLAAQNTPELTAKFSGSFISPSTQSLIDNQSRITAENSLSKSVLFTNQKNILDASNSFQESQVKFNSGVNNFSQQVKDAFNTILQPNTQTASTNDTVSKGTTDNPGKQNSFIDTTKAGFSEIVSQIGPGGLVAGALILGVIIFKK